jgi:hypothetical protein
MREEPDIAMPSLGSNVLIFGTDSKIFLSLDSRTIPAKVFAAGSQIVASGRAIRDGISAQNLTLQYQARFLQS